MQKKKKTQKKKTHSGLSKHANRELVYRTFMMFFDNVSFTVFSENNMARFYWLTYLAADELIFKTFTVK